MIYEGIKTREISFPLGGIGAGCIGLAGNGRLIDWEIFNKPAKLSYNGFSHFAVRAERGGEVVDARILHGDLEAPYIGSGETMYDGFGWGPSRRSLCGMPHFRNHVFKGEFPIAEIEFNDESFPGKVKLCAWSPFVPGNDVDSSWPGACFEYEILNDTGDELAYTLTGVLMNSWKGSNQYQEKRLTVKSEADPDALDYGEISLGTLEDEVSYQEYWYRGGWADNIEVYWNDLLAGGHFRNRSYPAGGAYDPGLLAAHFTLKPGERRRAVFVITWHVPNRKNDWSAVADERAAKNGLENRWRNWYATRWSDSADSNRYFLENYARLRTETFLFHDTLFASSLPPEVLDGISANLAVLKSPTCLRLEDGTFYGWEGVGIKAGSCEGSCTHVWNYAQALPFLFPALERSMREANYKYNLDENGGAHFRINLPLGIKAEVEGFQRPCVDGQFGDVMKTYREWKICGDTDWLRNLWPALKRTIEYAWSPLNYDRWDPEQTGVITGRQHHTLDWELFGPNAWLTGHYLGALKAASEMAEVLGEPEFAASCRSIYERGRAWVDEHLFNGEYYGQLIDLNDKSLLDGYKDTESYWDEERNEIKLQIGEGCGIDMHLPQWYAKLYGIGEILDPVRTRKTLESIFRYNYKASMRGLVNTWRNFAVNDEAGVIICSWPDGKRKPVVPLPYHSESMHGFEWALAAHLIMCGMVTEGLTVVKSIRSRYDGEKRNPWNEIECGSNYARSMASYGVLHSFSGFKFDMTRGMIGFEPVQKNGAFRCFWSLGTAWGEYNRDSDITITVKYGTLDLRELQLDRPARKLTLNGRSIAFKLDGNRIILPEPLLLNPAAGVLAIL